jgi:hypothetical protein
VITYTSGTDQHALLVELHAPEITLPAKNNLIRMDYPMHECTSREGDHDDWRTEKRNDIWVPSRHWREMTAHVEQDGHPSSNERLLGPFVCAI